MWTCEQAEGEMDKVRDGRLMKEMNRWRRHNRQEMEREAKRGDKVLLSCHASAPKSPADAAVYAHVFDCEDRCFQFRLLCCGFVQLIMQLYTLICAKDYSRLLTKICL